MERRDPQAGRPVTKHGSLPVFISAFALPAAEISRRTEAVSFFKWLRSVSARRGSQTAARPRRRSSPPVHWRTKSTAFATALTFFITQAAWAQPASYDPTELRLARPEVSVTAQSVAVEKKRTETAATQDFLASNDLPLSESKASDSSYANIPLERHDFDYAVELIREEFASAVILSGIDAENLRKLAGLSVETGVIVLHGEIVLFSSGSADGIDVLPAARELFGKASFVSHTHTGAHSEQGPSGADLNAAGERAEYVITRDGVYAYDAGGVLNAGSPLDYENYLDCLDEALIASRGARDQVEARRELNAFIAEADRFNKAPDREKEALLGGGTVSYTARLTSAGVTAVPGAPLPYYMEGSSAPTTLRTDAAGRFVLDYDVRARGSESGMAVSFDDASTPAVETRDLSTLGTWTLGLSGSANAVKMRFTDANGKQDTFTLTNVSCSAERFWKINLSKLASKVDKRRIVRVELFVDQGTTGTKFRTGSVSFRINGVNAAPPAPPAADPVTTVTNQSFVTLSGKKEANTAVRINGKEVVARGGSTVWSAKVALPAEGANDFTVQTENSVGRLSAPLSLTVVRDTVPPVLALEADTPGLINRKTLEVRYTADGEARTKVFDGLAEGENSLTVTETDPAGNRTDLAFKVTVDTIAPVIVIEPSTPDLINKKILTVRYTADGAVKERAFDGLSEGSNTVTLIERDAAGNETSVSRTVTVDTVPPEIVFTSPTIASDPVYTLTYLADGVAFEEVRILDEEGENVLEVVHADQAGNLTRRICAVHLMRGFLSDGTRLIYEEGMLVREITPSGEAVFFDAQGRAERFLLTDGRSVRYVHESPYDIVIENADGTLDRKIGPVSPEPPDLQGASSVTFEGGIKGHYRSGELLAIEMPEGILLFGLSVSQAGEILGAVVLHPDGRREIVWEGALLRSFGRDGSFTDLLPSGWTVREVAEESRSYAFRKTSQTASGGFRTFTEDGRYSIHDEFGILREAGGPGGERHVYDRQFENGLFHTALDVQHSSFAEDLTITEAWYGTNGSLRETRLYNGTRLYFENGVLNRAVNADGETADYEPILAGGGAASGFWVTHEGARFRYDQEGFLESVTTAQGTVTRLAEDADPDGEIPGEDPVRLILEMIGGDRITDLELDPDGNILSGILETQAGIQQHIENGALTGFETVDGRTYDYENGEAVLKEWKFRNGERVLFDGSGIAEILFPDGGRLHTIGFDAANRIETFTEELADGTRKVFSGDRLTTLVTPGPDGAEVHYGADGLAERVVFADGSEQEILYIRDGSGAITGTVFQGERERRIFAADGALVSLMTQGVTAEIAGGEIARLFTRFGRIEAPRFNAGGILSGEVDLIDTTKLVLESGELKEATIPGGTRVFYQSGKISAVETGGTRYELIYHEDPNGEFDGAMLRRSENGTVTETALFPYLLEHPESGLARALLARPLYDALDDRTGIRSELNSSDTFFAKIAQNPERGPAYEFNEDFFPSWAGLSPGLSAWNQGYVAQSVSLGGLPSEVSALTDIDGDGLVDRVFMDSDDASVWWVQKNLGSGFDAAMKWTGVQGLTNDPAEKAIRSYNGSYPGVSTDLVDMNGDGLPDRLLQRTDGTNEWYVQLNSGQGFGPLTLWGGQVHPLTTPDGGEKYLSEVRNSQASLRQELIADLIDLDGDGLPDRVMRPAVAPFDRWFFQKNTGSGFEDAVLWEGVDLGNNASPEIAGSLDWYQTWINGVMGANALADYLNRPGYDLSRWQQRLNYTLSAMSGCSIFNNPGCYNESYVRRFYAIHEVFDLIGTQSALADMNGDGLTDRVLVKQTENGAGPGFEWYVQFNTGQGFDAPELWSANLRSIPNYYSTFGGSTELDVSFSGISGLGQNHPQIGASIRVVNSWSFPRSILADLVDVTGDGLPDRVSVDSIGYTGSAQPVWWVEINNGHGFDPAAAWTGIFGANETETSIGQDAGLFQNWARQPGPLPYVKSRTALKDINGDRIPDRLIFRDGEDQWLVQYGTGAGFLPVEEMRIESLSAGASDIYTSRYDRLHVSLRAESGISAEQGSVRVTLDDPSRPESYQEWTVAGLTSEWKDFYLPLDKTKANASEVRVRFMPAEGNADAVPVYIDQMTFAALRPPAAKDWLDQLLTGEDVLASVHSARSQDVLGYLGASGASSAPAFDWDKLLKAETRIKFDGQGSALEFETLYGSVSRIENGSVVETELPDGTLVEFSQSSGDAPSTMTRTVTAPDGSVNSQGLAYGRVRTVQRSGQSALEYSYEFCSGGAPAAICRGAAPGEEITVVYDPDTGTAERYRNFSVGGQTWNVLVSRTRADGVTTLFEYGADGQLTNSKVSYKGRVREAFDHGVTADGSRFIVTEAGVREEYDDQGRILFHVTPEGYRYAHAFENARRVENVSQTVTETLPDGTVLTVRIPYVTLEDDPEGEMLHRVTLDSRTDPDGDTAYYGEDAGGRLPLVLERLVRSDGTEIFFKETRLTAPAGPESQGAGETVELLDAVVLHPDGTATEFRGGMPYTVISAAGRTVSLVIETGPNGEEWLVDPDLSTEFHLTQAKALWRDLVIPQWEEAMLPPALAVRTEYYPDGRTATRQFAEGTVELYGADGRIEQVTGPDGERLIFYDHDLNGDLVDVDMEGSRRRLESAALRLKADVAVEREEALARVAEREQVLSQTLEGEYLIQRNRLLAIRAQIESQRSQLASIGVKGKKSKGMVADAMAQIQAGMDQVNGALAQLALQRQEALEKLGGQVRDANLQIETESQKAYDAIREKEGEIRAAILKQELMPVIYHWYRKVLGRDPSEAEYAAVLSAADAQTGDFDLEGLKRTLMTGSEYQDRAAQVSAIQDRVMEILGSYLVMEDEERALLRADLGIPDEDAVEITASDVAGMRDWFARQTLHFGQSAFLSLEALLADAGITFERIELATQLILMDILTGTLTPLESRDLTISLYAMQRYAQMLGLNAQSYAMTYDALKALYDDAVLRTPNSVRFIALINGNHYVIVTAVTEAGVTYTDPGAGPEDSLESVSLSKEDFLEIWIDARAGHYGTMENEAGYILSAYFPPAASQHSALDAGRQMSVRGAFFPFLVLAVVAIVNAVTAAVSAVMAAITAIVGGLVTGIASVLTGIGSFFTGLFSGSFLAGISGLFQGIAAGLGHMAGGILSGVVAFGQGMVGTFSGLHHGLLAAVHGGFAASSGGFYASFFTKFFSGGLLDLGLRGAMTLLDAIGVSPKLQNPLISGGRLILGIGMLAAGDPSGVSFMAGGTAGFLGQFAGLASALSGLIGTSAAAIAAFAGGMIAPGITGLAVLKTALPNLSMDLASIGLPVALRAFDLDAGLARLLELPLSVLGGKFMAGCLGAAFGGSGLSALFDAARNAFLNRETLGGVFSIGAGIVLDRLNLDGSLLGALSSRVVAGVFGDFIASPMRFDFVESIIKSVDESVYHFLDPKKLPELLGLILDRGLTEGVERYAASLFTWETLWEFTRAGESLGQWIEQGIPSAEDIVHEGEPAKLLKLERNGKSVNFIYVPRGEKLEIRAIYEQSSDGKKPRFVSWETAVDGSITKVTVMERMPDGTYRTDTLDPAGRVREIVFQDWSGEAFGKLSFNGSGGIEFTNYRLGIADHLSADGRFTFDLLAAPDLQDLGQLLYDFNTELTPDSAAQLIGFTFGNGFWNKLQSPDSIAPLMAAFMQALASDQAGTGSPAVVLFDAEGNIARDRHGNVLTTGSLPVTLYEETSLVGNVLRWAAETWFGCDFMRDEIERELKNYFDLIDLNEDRFKLDPGMAFVHVAHSGNFQPMVEALEHMEDVYRSRIKTLVVYEGPYVGDGVIDDPYLETLIRVRGTRGLTEDDFGPPFLEDRQFSVTDKNGTVVPLKNQYNIVIEGAGHSDISYDPSFQYPSDEAREVARKTSLFMRDLTLVANDEIQLARFLSAGTPGISAENGVVNVDPVSYISPNGDR